MTLTTVPRRAFACAALTSTLLFVGESAARATSSVDPLAPVSVSAPFDPSVDAAPSAKPAAAAQGAPTRVDANPADAVKVAWVDADVTSQQPETLPYTLQQALDAAASSGGVVHVADGSLAFTKTLTVAGSVTVTAPSSTRIAALWSVSADDAALTVTDTVSLTSTASNSKAVVTVTSGRTGVTLENLRITAQPGVTGTTAVVDNGTGTTIRGLVFDGGGSYASTYGINARTASGTVVERSRITNVLVGLYAHNADTGAGPTITGTTIDAANFGVQVGTKHGTVLRDVTITGSGATKNGAAVDLASSHSAVLEDVRLSGFDYGVKTIVTSGTGVQLARSTVSAATTGVHLGATTGATLDDVTITGTGTATTGVDGAASGVTLRDVTIDGFATGFRSTARSGQGLAADDVSIEGATTAGMNVGSTTGARLNRVTIALPDAVTTTSVALDLPSAEDVVVADLSVTGYGTAVRAAGAPTQTDDARRKHGLTVAGGTFTNVGTGVSVSYFDDVEVAGTTMTLRQGKGTGVYASESGNLTVDRVTVDGATAGAANGTLGVQTYYSSGIDVTASTFTTGATALYFDMTDGVTIDRVHVEGMSQYGSYTERAVGVDVGHSTFVDNATLANYATNPTQDDRNTRGPSEQVRWHHNTISGPGRGIILPMGFEGFEFDHNDVSGLTSFVVLASPARGVHVHGNTIDFTVGGDENAGAITIGNWYAALDTDDYASSDVAVTGNTFTGEGAFVRVGTTDRDRPALADVVLVKGNTFPVDAVAVDVRANAGGDDSGVAVDATDASASRRADGPSGNDFGSVCRARATVDGTVVHGDVTHRDGVRETAGAFLHQATAGQVLFPEVCIDLGLTQDGPTAGPYAEGDLVTWTLTPYSDGMTTAPAGWTVTTELPAGLELVELSGPGYAFDGATATAAHALPPATDGPRLQVTARVADVAWGDDESTRELTGLRAFVAPADTAAGEGPAVFESHKPLGAPDTNNVTHATVWVEGGLPGAPDGMPDGGTTAPDEETTAVEDGPTGPGDGLGGPGDGLGGPDGGVGAPDDGLGVPGDGLGVPGDGTAAPGGGTSPQASTPGSLVARPAPLAPTPSPQARALADDDAQLASTGLDAAGVAALAGVLVLGGLGAAVAARARRPG